MITAVLDANVLASGFVGHGQSPPVLILDAWRAASFTLVVSEHLLTELAHTFEDRYFRQRLTQEHVAADVRLLRRRATVAAITVQVQGVATHPEDDRTLATAVSAKTQYLVTGDKKLRALGLHRGVRIVTPREFLEIFAEQADGGSE